MNQKTIKLKGGRIPVFMDRLSGRIDSAKDIITIDEDGDKIYLTSAWIVSKNNALQAYTSEIFTSTGRLISEHAKTIASQLHRINEIEELLNVLNKTLENSTEENINVRERRIQSSINQIVSLKNEKNQLETQIEEVKIEIEQIKHYGFQRSILAKEKTLYKISNYIRGAKIGVRKDFEIENFNYEWFKTFEAFSTYLKSFLKGE